MSGDVPADIAYQELWEEIIFEQLISTTRAKDPALDYYKNELKKQKASEQDFRQFAKEYASIVVKKYKKTTKDYALNLTPEEKKEIVSNALQEAWKKYNI